MQTSTFPESQVINQHIGEHFAAYHADCVEGSAMLPDNSVGYSIFSPPFASLYTYSASDRDMGNCSGDDSFFEHFGYLIEQLFRITKPGRLVSFHCMNMPTTKTRDGFIGIKDFRGDLIRAFQSKGFIYHSEVCIWKDPVTAMQRTKAIGLLHKQVVKDSCMSRQGVPDYLVTMRKPGVNESPVAGEFKEYVGEEGTGPTRTGDFRADHMASKKAALTRYSIEVWQRYASPVWMDINPSDTLQFRSAREQNDERHICPLQLQVIERGMALWSNPGDVVYTPFAGIGSEMFTAIQNGRYAIGHELKESYYKQTVANCLRAEKKRDESDLFVVSK